MNIGSFALRGVIAAGVVISAAPAGAQSMEGKAIFQKNCAACHQLNGRGIPGAFPALAGNAFVKGAAGEVVAVLLKGRGGMPDFSDVLPDQQIAQVLSYARNAWGNVAAPVTADEVSALRRELKLGDAAAEALSNKH